ncbi:inorganic diphosphatase [Polymorphobacter fuscus]|uniref:Inorganic pyrophosphatase n=1 Tax=Sandarakinorhabdus fusca TaxID=1439888 RepID=A0A7C9KHL0_9SPHN|nr:inorganic diphosphatase [Polymorphobacter fuscus]KAB7648892.1 inorganic diphosphatase [Polymorphobacter fuscus]MQT16479.1 inorganic diphosphatase [Polymorphobacter fuscus]NJC07231.1 inorganic pyrophosphatase [Polymorphobacter fuscus]
MRIDQIPIGVNPPHDVNVIIECPLGGEPVKYEIDKASGALFVDRILHTAMRYPTNYGFIPNTLADDGDPIDALVVARTPLIPGCIIRVRPVGVMMMEDDGGGDAKLLCVSVNKVYPYYSNVAEYTDLPDILLQQIEHFFTHYKDLEPGKWVKFQGWEGRETAERLILESIDRYNDAQAGVETPALKEHPGAPRA